jgi:Putative zinc-finger
MNEFACDEIDAVAAELALGILPGDERAEALRHLAGCPACRDRVDAMAHVADQLLLAAPEEEPPIGFESKVLDRIASERLPAPTQIHRRRRWTVAAVGVAAAAVLFAAALAGIAAGRANERAGHRGVESAVVSFGQGEWVCRVTAFAGRGTQPTELVIRLDEPPQPSPIWYTVQAEPSGGGAPVPIGTIHIQDGRGTIDTSVPLHTGKVRGIRVFDMQGHLTYEANFTAV